VSAATTSPRVVLLDSGGANLGSVQAAFARLGVAAPVSSDEKVIRDATHVVLPGVGAAAAAMRTLRGNGLDQLVPTLTQPMVGIWGGMQWVYGGSEEGDTTCLGLLPGHVRRLPASDGVRIPHMGWNRLQATGTHPLVAGLTDAWVYFVHGYGATPAANALATSTHGEPFCAVVADGRVMGAQFHPERSSTAGARLLRNFLAIPS